MKHPQDARRILDIGTGDERLLALMSRSSKRSASRSSNEDPSDRVLDVHTQLRWLREIGFDDVECYWKWLEMALLIEVRP